MHRTLNTAIFLWDIFVFKVKSRQKLERQRTELTVLFAVILGWKLWSETDYF